MPGRWVFLLAFLVMALSGVSAPRMGVMLWPEDDHPVWGPRLEKNLRELIDADSVFGGAVALEPILRSRHLTLGAEQFLARGSKDLAPLFAIDEWVHLEWVDETPRQRIERATWMPWKASETWSLPLRLTIWEAATGKVRYAGIVPGDTTVKANRFWPYRTYEGMTFTEREALRDRLLEKTLTAVKDTLTRVVLGR